MTALAALIDRSRREREDWRYTNVEKLIAAILPREPVSASHALPGLVANAAERQQIVFTNGVWDKDKTQLGKAPAAFVQGDAAGGYRLEFAAQSCLVSAPLELVFMGDTPSDVKLAVDVGANTSLTLIEHHSGKGGAHIIETDIRLAAQAKLMRKKFIHDCAGAAHFARTRVRVAAGAYYRHFDLVMNAQILRSEIDVTLEGALAQCGLYGAMLLRGSEHADILTRVHHAAREGTSAQLYKAIVKDKAHGVFQGRIKVAAGADKTEGRQLCRALLLSDQAEMDAKPELEINADDVSCSHGCAVGELEADAMFYLRSRGLSEDAARSLLLHAFVDEALDTIQAEDARSYARSLAERWMNEQA